MVDIISQSKKPSAKHLKLVQEFVSTYSAKLSNGLVQQMLDKLAGK
jgi:hypothetical protein